MEIKTIVDSRLSTELLTAMAKTNKVMIRNMKAIGVDHKELTVWQNRLELSVAIRGALRANHG